TKGHMLAYMRIYSDEDSFLIDTETGEADKIIQILNRYLFREDVKIEDVSLQYGLVTIQGPLSRNIISKTSGTDIKEMAECSHINIGINGINCKITRTAYTGEEGYDIYAPWNDLHIVWEIMLRGAGPVPSTPLRTGLREVEGVRAVLAVEEVKVVTAEGKIVLGDDTTPARARAIAMNNARRTALEEAVGVNLHGSSVIYNSELVSDLVITATKGLIVKQNVLEDRCYTEEDRIYCLVRIEAHVKPLPQPDSKKVSILKASIRRPDKDTPANSPVFQDGDEIQIKAAASDNVFINIFSIDQYGNVIKLYPNNYIKSEIIPSGSEFVFPDDSLRNQGLKLRVTTPNGLKSGIESVLIIATKEKGFFLTDPDIQNPTISDLMNELSKL
ncbi:MAG: DUF4384 domain-containing protein, partial [Nitrospirota bacterium]